MTHAALLGWDVGGAHLKRAVFDAAGTLLEVDLAPLRPLARAWRTRRGDRQLSPRSPAFPRP